MRTLEEWNERFPEGTNVRYFPVLNNMDDSVTSSTRSVVYELGDGTPVVALKGKSGSVSVRHLLKI